MLSIIKQNTAILLLISVFWIVEPIVLRTGIWYFIVIWCGCTGLITVAFVRDFIDEICDQIKVKDIITKGQVYSGTVIDYCDDWDTVINGVPYVDLVVKFIEFDNEKIMVFPAGTTKSQKFPIGMRIYVYKYNDEYAATQECGKIPLKYKI